MQMCYGREEEESANAKISPLLIHKSSCTECGTANRDRNASEHVYLYYLHFHRKEAHMDTIYGTVSGTGSEAVRLCE